MSKSLVMERKIGEIFEYNNEWYQCIEAYDKCSHCCFEVNYYTCGVVDPCCSGPYRKDRKNVIFRKLKKVGEPFTVGKKLYQHYKVFDIDNVCGDDSWNIHSYEAKTILIELKQNKEDMKTVKISKDDLNFLINKIRYGILPKHIDYNKITNEISKLFSIDNIEDSNSENIGKNLKPFDLEAAKAGKPVCTRDGRKARIICFDYKGDANAYPILALISTINLSGVPSEIIAKYTEDGRYAKYNNVENNEDLMMVPEKKEGWAKVRKDINLYDTKEEADRKMIGNDEYVTAKVFWEE